MTQHKDDDLLAILQPLREPGAPWSGQDISGELSFLVNSEQHR